MGIFNGNSIYKFGGGGGGGSWENVTDKIYKYYTFDLEAFKSGDILILFIKINNTLPSFSGWNTLAKINDDAGFKFSGVFSGLATCFYDAGTTPNTSVSWVFSNVKILSSYQPFEFFDNLIRCYDKNAANALVTLVCPVIDA